MAPLKNPGLHKAVAIAGGKRAMAAQLRECGHHVKGPTTVHQWLATRVPAEYCPDIEHLTGVRCEQLRPDINWAVLRKPIRATV